MAVVVSFNAPEDLERTIAALTFEVDRVYVVDNGSSSENVENIVNLQKKYLFECDFLKENFGIGYALNKAVTKASQEDFDWLLTMDQDSIFKPGFMKSFYDCAYRTNTRVLSANIGSGHEESFDSEKLLAITSGNLVHLSVFDQVGTYNEWLFIDGVDFEFSFRLQSENITIMSVCGAVLNHKLGDQRVRWLSRVHSFHSPLRRYYIFRNHLYLMRLFFDKFPWEMTKITASRFLYIFTIIIFGRDRIKSLSNIFQGFEDYFRGVSGRKSIPDK